MFRRNYTAIQLALDGQAPNQVCFKTNRIIFGFFI